LALSTSGGGDGENWVKRGCCCPLFPFLRGQSATGGQADVGQEVNALVRRPTADARGCKLLDGRLVISSIEAAGWNEWGNEALLLAIVPVVESSSSQCTDSASSGARRHCCRAMRAALPGLAACRSRGSTTT
jgi:hypothetical protein